MKINLADSAVVILVLCNASRAASANSTDTDTLAINDVRPLTVLEYKPISSFHHPEPFTLGQLVSAGTPWPDSTQTTHKSPPLETETKLSADLGNQSSRPGPVSSTPPSASSLENKFGGEVKPSIVLGYKPTRPPYVPDPVTIGQMIPSGTPWPDSPEGYKTTIKTVGVNNATVKPITVLEYKPTRPSFLPEPSTVAQLVPSGSPWPASANVTLKPQREDEGQPPATVLQYKPTRPSFLPDPVTIGQLIPSGTPWPDSPEGYKTTIKSVGVTNATSNVKPITFKPTRPSFLPEPSGTPWPASANATLKPQEEPEGQPAATVLQYKPTRPSFLPDPVTIGQLIPSGTPWPDSPEGYKTTPKNSTVAQEVNATAVPQETTRTRSSPTTHIVLEYTPQRPWYLPEPVTIGQLIPPGTPWPDSPRPTVKPAEPSPIAQRPETTTPPPRRTTKRITQRPFSSTHIVLGYKPTRPWYLPEPVTIGQLIGPGKPWPAHADDFSETRPQVGHQQSVGNSLA